MNYFSSEFTEENKFGSHRIKVTFEPPLRHLSTNITLCYLYARIMLSQLVKNKKFCSLSPKTTNKFVYLKKKQ